MRITFALMLAVMPATVALTAPASADISTDTVRQRAEQACYDDATKLCNDAIPDEAKITACMSAHHAQLSTGCRKVFDAGRK